MIDGLVFGVRIWVWLIFLIGIGIGTGAIVYYFRERLLGKYYQIRYPEKAFKAVIHYPGGLYKEYWRLIPKDQTLDIDNLPYRFNREKLEIKDGDTILDSLGSDDEKYITNFKRRIQNRSNKFQELHYFYNNMEPLEFKNTGIDASMTSDQWSKFVKNDLLGKLLTLNQQGTLILLILLMSAGSFLLSAFLVAKQMGWLNG